jgi:NRAMP (natural resistance-associated macrophage protein)-like metal ion transporter
VRPVRAVAPGVRLTARGRSIKLRRLRHAPRGVWWWLAILGPGVVASVAGDDAGGIATNSQIGAAYGYDLLWALLLLTVALGVVQEMAARLGVATGSGLLDLIRERFGIGWALVAVTTLLVANGGVTMTEFAGVGAAAELFGISRFVAVPASAVMVWLLVLYGSYAWAERVLLLMTLAFLAYPVAAVLAHPDWSQVLQHTLVPTIHMEQNFWLLLVAMVGTTITPYQQLFQQSAVVEKGVAIRDYAGERADAFTGALVGNLIWAFIIIATAATLHVAGQTDVATASGAARALEPLAGPGAAALFAVGLLGASLLAAAVVPLATAYAVSEAFGFRKGVGLDFRRAPIFYGLFTALIALGAAVALVPTIPLFGLLLGVQVLNGALLPVVLVFILLLASDRRLMGKMANKPVHSVLGWGTLGLVLIAIAVLLLSGASSAS